MVALQAHAIIHERYRIERQIGQGGMGAVYEAVDLRLRRRVALKQLLIDDSYVSHAFEREAQLLANLDHPALPTVSDHFTDQAGQFLVMQYIPGDDLGTLLAQRETPFPWGQVLDWARQLLDALDYLHTQQQPILHRDIKPQNLKLKDRGQLMLLDFGLAKGRAGGMLASSMSSMVAFTFGFAPPEQVEGTHTDARSDLYALGATLHRLLTNVGPVEALIRFRVLARQGTDPLRPVHELNPAVPKAISRILQQTMALEMDDRPSSARELRMMLDKVDHRTTNVYSATEQPKTDTRRVSSTQSIPTSGKVISTGSLRYSRWKAFLQFLLGGWIRQPASPNSEPVTRMGSQGAVGQAPTLSPRSSSSTNRKTVYFASSRRPPYELPRVEQQNTRWVRYPQMVRQREKHVFEELVLHKDYDRLWRAIAYAEGGRYILTGYGPFGGTSLVDCAIAKARAELEQRDGQEGALLVFHFRLTSEYSHMFEIEANNFSLGHLVAHPKEETSMPIKALDAFGHRQHSPSDQPIQRIDFSLAHPLRSSFFEKTGRTVLPAKKPPATYDISEFVNDLRAFFEERKDGVSLRQIVLRLLGSKVLPTRVVVIFDKIQYQETLEALADFDFFGNKHILALVVARKEEYDQWQDAEKLLRRTGFTKWYVPCLWKADVEQLLFDKVTQRGTPDEQWSTFCKHLRYVGRGSFGNMIDELRRSQNISHDPDTSFVNLADMEHRVDIRHNGWMQDLLDLNWHNILADLFRGKYQIEDQDRARLGVYEIIDWIAETRHFSYTQLVQVADSQRIKIADELAVVRQTLSNLLYVLIQASYLRQHQEKYRIVWDAEQPAPIRKIFMANHQDASTGPPAPLADDVIVIDGVLPGMKQVPEYRSDMINAPQMLCEEVVADPRQRTLTDQKQIFISYSHKDARWLDRLQVHLKPLERLGKFSVWSDIDIRPGELWKEEIEKALDSAKVAILMVSADFLASDFIAETELPILLSAAQERGAVILPVIIGPSLFPDIEIGQFQPVNDPSRPLVSLQKPQQEEIFVRIVRTIEKLLSP